MALDHLNYVNQGQKRHAWIFLDGKEIGQLPIADPALRTVTLPHKGKVEIGTHDSTVWWVGCPPDDGWKLIDIACDDQNSKGDLATKTATFHLEAGETVKCTFTNQKLGTIIVEKQTDPDGDPAGFTFEGTAAGTISDGGHIVVPGLEAGSYTSTEFLPASECATDAIPEIKYLGADANLEAGSLYLVKGPRAGIVQTFSQRLWEEQFDPSSHWAALVRPVQNVTWPHNAWKVQGGWRTPYVMHSPLGDDIDIVSLGDFQAGEEISLMALDHLNYIHRGQKRHAWIYLVHAQGETKLGELEIADPARITVKLPKAGEVQIRTHDSTLWWSGCLPTGWELVSIKCDDKDSKGDLEERTATFKVDAGETVKCTFTNRKHETKPDDLKLPEIAVASVAVPEKLVEPGGAVALNVRVLNVGSVPVTLNSLADGMLGDLAAANQDLQNPASSTCKLPQRINIDGFYECAFQMEVTGAAGDKEMHTVVAIAEDDRGNQAEASHNTPVAIVAPPVHSIYLPLALQ
jgi:plastocyanin